MLQEQADDDVVGECTAIAVASLVTDSSSSKRPCRWPRRVVGTKIHFELKREDDFTVVMFRHEGWKESVEFMYHCSTKWATFLMSLKSLGETGKGQSSPNDVKISNWH